MLESFFITGTDTDIGKTYVTAGLASTFRKMGVDIGVMKPFAAGIPQKNGFKSEDVEILSAASHTRDPEELINPQFFPIPASPYTAWRNLKTRPRVSPILSGFKKLSRLHDAILVEGMGGIMTPVLKNYFIADLIRDMDLPTVIVARSRVGTISHTVMTVRMCKEYEIPIKGIIINDSESDGYVLDELKRDLKSLLGVPILGSIPFIDDLDDPSLPSTFEKSLDMKRLMR